MGQVVCGVVESADVPKVPLEHRRWRCRLLRREQNPVEIGRMPVDPAPIEGFLDRRDEFSEAEASNGVLPAHPDRAFGLWPCGL